MKSIIQNEKECYICRTNKNLHEHHIIHGPNRNNSEKYGLKVWLCSYHHNMGGTNGVHGDAKKDLYFKRLAQRKFEESHTREEFMQIFGKNYLE